MKAAFYHVDKDNLITLVCPSCQKASRVSVLKFRDKKHTLTTRCRCDCRFEIQLNFRKYYRKNVNIVGEVIVPTGHNTNSRKVITICDLSKTGLRFQMVGNMNLKIGDVVRVKFDLETKRPTTIEKEVIIRFVSKEHYGCEFIELEIKERELGFFLLG